MVCSTRPKRSKDRGNTKEKVHSEAELPMLGLKIHQTTNNDETLDKIADGLGLDHTCLYNRNKKRLLKLHGSSILRHNTALKRDSCVYYDPINDKHKDVGSGDGKDGKCAKDNANSTPTKKLCSNCGLEGLAPPPPSPWHRSLARAKLPLSAYFCFCHAGHYPKTCNEPCGKCGEKGTLSSFQPPLTLY